MLRLPLRARHVGHNILRRPRTPLLSEKFSRRRFSDTPTNKPVSNNAKHAEVAETAVAEMTPGNQPPFLIRAALVGSTVGLATPLFATAGIGLFWYRWAPISTLGRAFKAGVAVLIGGGSYKMVSEYAWPFVRDHGDLVLPFALSTALTSGAWYAFLEATLGIKFMAGMLNSNKAPGFFSSMMPRFAGGGMPVGGPLVGCLTAVTTCFLWPACIKACWGDEAQEILLGVEKDASFLLDAYLHLGVPTVAVPLGVAAGLGTHLLLAPTMLGRIQTPWPRVVVPVLGGIVGLSAFYFYRARQEHSVADMFWIDRFNDETGEVYSYNLRDGRVLADPKAASRASTTRWTLDSLHQMRSRKQLTPPPVTARALPDLDKDVRYRDIEARRHLLQTVDLLVRAKRLELELQKIDSTEGLLSGKRAEVVKAMKDLEAFATDKLGFSGLFNVLEASEALIALRRHATQPGGADNQLEDGQDQQGLHKVLARLTQFNLGGEGTVNLTLLGGHAGVLDRELQQRLGYTVPESKGEAFAVKEQRRDTTKKVLRIVALVVSLAPVVGAAIDMYLDGRK